MKITELGYPIGIWGCWVNERPPYFIILLMLSLVKVLSCISGRFLQSAEIALLSSMGWILIGRFLRNGVILLAYRKPLLNPVLIGPFFRFWQRFLCKPRLIQTTFVGGKRQASSGRKTCLDLTSLAFFLNVFNVFNERILLKLRGGLVKKRM